MNTPSFKYLIMALIAGMTAWQLFTGRARKRNWQVVTRKDDPGSYWFIIIIEVVLFFAALFLVHPRYH